MSPIVISETREDLIVRREEILRTLAMTEIELSNIAATRSLTGDERDGLEELREIAFLLGEKFS